MLRLTLTSGEHVFVTPEQITAVRQSTGRTQVYTTFATDKTDYISVKESPVTVARLKAAWESRNQASRLKGELPIFVYADEVLGFQFNCCEYTRAKRLVAAKQGLGGEAINLNKDDLPHTGVVSCAI